MVVLRFKSPRWTFLVGFPIFLIQSVPSALSPVPGSPLKEDEYKVFFSSLRPTWKARVACQIRRSKGCQDPRIKQLDQYENHGQIPEGPICTDLPDDPSFETFCLFAEFRCLNQKFYIKRILCPTVTAVEETFHSLETAPGQGDTVLLIHASSPSPPDNSLHSNIDAILKYSFAVSGQEPVPRKQTQAPRGKWGTLQTPSQEEEEQQQPGDSKAGLPTATPVTVISVIQNIETTEGHTDEDLWQNIHHLIGAEFSLEQPPSAESTEASGEITEDLDLQEAIPADKSKGSLLGLEKDEALVILCFAVLQDICISSAVSQAWRKMEAETLGFGNVVCDSLGRRHADLCAQCAFCSLKREQCQGGSNLRRVHCDDGTFTTYINPEVLAQHRTVGTMVPLGETEYYGMEEYEGLRAQHWCDRLAIHGCDDSHVHLWLKTEYSNFNGGDFPSKICDSTRILHPNYCAFKSHQCLQYSLTGNKVLRRGCLKHTAYRVLSEEEGEEEVRLWSQKFLTFPEG